MLPCLAMAATAVGTTMSDHANKFAVASTIDAAINQAIKEGRLPGAVVIVRHNGRVVFRKAYGQRAVIPVAERMTLDTIFDCRLSFGLQLHVRGRVRTAPL